VMAGSIVTLVVIFLAIASQRARGQLDRISYRQRGPTSGVGLTCARSGFGAPHRPLAGAAPAGPTGVKPPCPFVLYGKHSRASHPGYYFDIWAVSRVGNPHR
jgi:hypothetical protein